MFETKQFEREVEDLVRESARTHGLAWYDPEVPKRIVGLARRRAKLAEGEPADAEAVEAAYGAVKTLSRTAAHIAAEAGEEELGLSEFSAAYEQAYHQLWPLKSPFDPDSN